MGRRDRAERIERSGTEHPADCSNPSPLVAKPGVAYKTFTQGAKPLGKNGYKVQLLAAAVKRAVLTAAGAKKYWEA